MVVDIKIETARAKTFRLALAHPSPHLAGQHYVVRLTAPDGYTASRSYSVASPPDGSNAIDLTVERLEDGEVSTFLHDEVVIGDELEVRGPIGGFFVWKGDTPALLLAGGSGIVPLMAMLRLARKTGQADRLKLLVSVRSPDDLFYADELAGPETTVVYTRLPPPGVVRPAGRLTHANEPPALAPASPRTCAARRGSPTRPAISSWISAFPCTRRVERFGPDLTHHRRTRRKPAASDDRL